MVLRLNISALRSRVKSAEITLKREAVSQIFGGVKGALMRIFNFGGFLFREISSRFNFKFTDLWGLIVQAYFTIKTFDWNQTDKSIQDAIEQNNKQLVTRAAEVLGEATGWATVRLVNFAIGRIFAKKDKEVPGSIKVPVLSGRVGLALAEEGNEELKSGMKRLLNATVSSQVSNAFLSFILTSRKNEWFGQKSITTAQANGSIAEKIDNAIETLPKFWQNAAEEFIDGFEDAILEAGYVVSMTIDDHYAATKAALNDSGPIRTIEVKTHPDSDEKLIVKGPQQHVSQALLTGLGTTFPLIENRDVGQIAAAPINESIKLKPQLRQMTITYNEYDKPPFKRKGIHGTRAEISIPDVKAGVSWNEVKTAARKYTRGDVFVSCTLENGRQMSGYFVSENEGKKTLRELNALSSVDIDELAWRASSGEASAGTHKKSKLVYPVKAALIFPKKKIGRNTVDLGKPTVLPLWVSDEPEGGFRGDP